MLQLAIGRSELNLYHFQSCAPNTIHIGYAQTFEEAYERVENLYQDLADGEFEENPPVEDFLIWRDLRVFDGNI